MKTVYICGDSFAVADTIYLEKYWVDLLQDQLGADIKIQNLGRVSASNLHIAMQVEHALQCQADFVIVLATSSLRTDVSLGIPDSSLCLLERYVNLTQPNCKNGLVSTSISYLKNNNIFSKQQAALLQQFYAEFADVEVEVFKSKLIIEATLHKLKASGTPFLFDRGGFEHPNFAGSKTQYFSDYREFFSDINLWDHVTLPMPLRPYYHITDVTVHQTVADYYCQKIQENFQKN
jgi:hypothetical protein